ncbi:hypothetical protein PAXINDRAFT_20199 [Paxillus involutus ATCC 200175]|uniref:Uncharacterized protein n=1 Tax=Paxillus involutus ATCC 200175 TaxID=664439 RepID=A0A0C9TH65_PAXIN|nr:hypothetical protein PAXINDRAFT_20199 [Paxillus involutus ATCC 200175]
MAQEFTRVSDLSPDCVHNASMMPKKCPSPENARQCPHLTNTAHTCPMRLDYLNDARNASITPEKHFSRPYYVHDAPNGSVTPERCSSPLEKRLSWLKSPDPTNCMHNASTATRKKYLSLRPKSHARPTWPIALQHARCLHDVRARVGRVSPPLVGSGLSGVTGSDGCVTSVVEQ